MRKFITILVLLIIIFLVVSFIWYWQETRFYNIQDDKISVESALESHLNSDIDIEKMLDVDNKKYFLFTFKNGTVGSGEFTKGINGKYKYEYAGYGTNWIRERVVTTDKSYYLMLAGRNLEGINVIEAYIEGDKYNINIPDGEYYLVLTPIKETTLEFTSGMIIYDKNGKEIERLKLPSK